MTAPSPSGLDIQGHRGARGLRPENTLPSFEKALDLMVTTLELDLHLSSDGEVVVWHDPVISAEKCRLDPDSEVAAPDPDDPATAEADLMVSRLTRAQLGAYRCDRNPEPERFPDQEPAPGVLSRDDFGIVTLGELFDFVKAYADSEVKTPEQRENAARVGLNVETKRNPARPALVGDGFDGSSIGFFEKAIVEEVRRRDLVHSITVQSFDHRSLWAIHHADQGFRLAALTPRGEVPDFEELAAQGAVVWSPEFSAVDEGTLAAAHSAGLEVIPWTVNDPTQMKRLSALGVDGLITDRPDLVP